MESPIHDLASLFKQLGLESSEKAIEAFVGENPVPSRLPLHQADFWNTAQASFLKQAIEEDADWAAIVDKLNTLMRNNHHLA